MTKLNPNEEVSMSILMRICGYLKCDIGDICEITQNQTNCCLPDEKDI